MLIGKTTLPASRGRTGVAGVLRGTAEPYDLKDSPYRLGGLAFITDKTEPTISGCVETIQTLDYQVGTGRGQTME